MRCRPIIHALVASSIIFLARCQILGTVSVLAGGFGGTSAGYADGTGTAAAFRNPWGIALSPNGTFALIVSGVFFLHTGVPMVLVFSRISPPPY